MTKCTGIKHSEMVQYVVKKLIGRYSFVTLFIKREIYQVYGESLRKG